MNEEQFNQILAYIPQLKIRKWEDSDIEWLFRICRKLALRMGEAVKLAKEDFDFERREVDLHQTKTKKNDSAVIPKDFVLDLDGYLWTKDVGPLFPGLTVETVRPWLLKLGKALDIKAFTTPQSESGEKTKCHIFRKSRGKDLLYDGTPLNIIQGIYRHNSLDTTSKYLKAAEEAIKEII
jgi:integrase